MAENILEIADAFRASLLKKESDAAARLIQAYDATWRRLSKQLTALNKQIEAARNSGEMVNQAWLFRQERYGALLRQIDEEFKRFADVAQTAITNRQRAAVKAAISNAVDLMGAAANDAGIAASFNRLPTAAAENIVGFLGDGSPLKRLLDQLPRNAGAIVANGLIQGVTTGRSPADIAREIREGLEGNRKRALTIARTETARAYNAATSQSYQANSDVVEGWYWRSARNKSCAACVAMDGTFHPVNEPMKSHPNCRCVMIPAVEGVEVDKGADWFKKQPAKVQKEIIGTKAGYQALKSGALQIEDFVGLRRNPAWGDNYHQLSVKQALAGAGKFPGDAAKPQDIIPPISQPPQPKPKPKPKPEPKPEAFKEFKRGDYKAAAKYGDEKWGKWMNESITAEEKRGVQDYVGNWYDPINRYLRQGPEAVYGVERGPIRQKVARIDAALKKAKVPENAIVYRGGNFKDFHQMFTGGRLINSVHSEDAYWSTSFDEGVSRNFASAYPMVGPSERENYPALMRIKVRKGQAGAYVSNINREFHPERPNYDNGEAELLFPRGIKYHVLNARFEDLGDGRRLLLMDVEIWKEPKKEKTRKR